jgi:hypothetical protein
MTPEWADADSSASGHMRDLATCAFAPLSAYQRHIAPSANL